MPENEENKKKVGDRTVIPLANGQYRFIEKERNNEGKLVTTRDENYREVVSRHLIAAEEDVAGKAIRNLTGKGPEAKYVKTGDNKENQNEE